jgi:anti-sigma factor RsiW
MNCAEARDLLLDRRRDALGPADRARVDEHLASCDACRRVDEEDRELSRALEERLPKHRAPAALRSAIEAQLLAGALPPRRARRPGRARAAVAMVGVAAFAAAGVLVVERLEAPNVMVAEAVNDHLRVLYSEHPLEVESGGVHQVKPWFEGRVDFAPLVAFGGDDDFPLQGGAIANFVDRKAAAYIYRRRLHWITLLVYRADGLPWPPAPTVHLGHVSATERTLRGFHALIWRDGDLGYALVSDVDARDLESLGSKIAGSPPE